MNPKLQSDVKVFEKQVKYVGQGHQFKSYGTTRQGLLQGTHRQSMKVVSVKAKVKVFENWLEYVGQGHQVKKYVTNRKVL